MKKTTKADWEVLFDEEFQTQGILSTSNLSNVGEVKDFIRSLLSKDRARLKKRVWSYAKEECDSFDFVGIHRCSAGHCSHCEKCDVLSGVLALLGDTEEEKHV